MQQLTTASTKVAAHVATNRRPVPPAFTSRYSAERYLAAHTRRAWQEPDPAEARAAVARAAEQAQLARLDSWLARVNHTTARVLLGLLALLAVAGYLR